MMARRVTEKVTRPAAIPIFVNGAPAAAYPGETVAGALLAHGVRTFRTTSAGKPRGPFCGMGVCFDCVVRIDGRDAVRACMTPVRPGMRIDVPNDEKKGNER